MKLWGVIFSIILTFSTSGVSAQSSSIVTFTILPGPFTATMQQVNGLPTLVVDDLTGSGHGWQVQVECTCQIQRIGDLQTISGQQDPQWMENVLVAQPGSGGLYEQVFADNPGVWTITEVSGP